jgi:hypothetical protein
MKLWPNFDDTEISEKPNLTDFLKFIVRERKNDREEYINLPQVFVSGRKVGKIPTSAVDVAATDRAGDTNYDDQYLYILTIDSMGDPAWGRAALDTGW